MSMPLRQLMIWDIFLSRREPQKQNGERPHLCLLYVVGVVTVVVVAVAAAT